jgi:hypothetical protein
VASVTVVASSLTWADIDATAAYAHGRDAARWLETRPSRTALVVWVDGSTTLIEGPSRSIPLQDDLRAEVAGGSSASGCTGLAPATFRSAVAGSATISGRAKRIVKTGSFVTGGQDC